jgi:pantoate kinase
MTHASGEGTRGADPGSRGAGPARDDADPASGVDASPVSSAVWRRTAWAPAHVTGFFEIRDEHANPYRRGSRGAGLNLELGVTAEVAIEEGGTGTEIRIEGEVSEAPTVQTTIKGLLGDDYPARVTVDLTSGLPSGQGFGLSGAGALATGVALSDLLGFPVKTAVWEAHRADVVHRTGLGDVPAQALGGAEVRITPGPMPMGVIERFAGLEARRSEVLCCVLEGELSTRSVLEDDERRRRINEAGADAVARLKAEPTLERYMALSAAFADQVGLIGPELAEALREANRFGWATQTMLGNALHLIIDPKVEGHGDPDGAVAALSAHGQVWRTRISARGARCVR